MKMIINKKIWIILLLGILIIPAVSSLLGTFEKEKDIELIQTCNNCTSCNLTAIKYPNGTNILTNVEMTEDGTYYNYTLDGDNVTEIGTYKYCYDCGNAVESKTGCIDFQVTLSGDEPPEGQSYILAGIIFVLFGIACVFLWLSNQIVSPGVKIFFLLAGFIFLLGCLATITVIAFDSNLTSGVNLTMTSMLFAMGLIVFVIFAYVLINQIIDALNLYRIRKGYEVEG